MRKEEFYMTGFYCLIGLIIGFVIGTFTTEHSIQVRCVIAQDSIQCDSFKNISYTKPANISDDILLHNLKFHDIQHPKIVLAQAKLETGNYTSAVYKKHNNLFGLMKGSSYHTFNHWEESVLFYKEHIQNRYKGGDYLVFLNKIGYAEDVNYTKKLKHIVNTIS